MLIPIKRKPGKSFLKIGFLLILTLFLLLFPSNPALAAGATYIHINSISPSANALDIAQTTNISIVFDADINSSTVTADTFNVDGSISGKITGTYNTSGATVTFTPTDSFEFGETVTVTLTTDVRSVTNGILEVAKTWQFTVTVPYGSGTFTDATINYGTGSDWTGAVACGDVDNDGDLDIVCINLEEANTVYLNSGATFTSSSSFGSGVADYVAIPLELADLNNDGYSDVVVGSRGYPNMVYLNNSNGTFDNTGFTVGTGSDQTFCLATGDVNGDGFIDIACGNYSEQDIIYLNDGSGGFSGDVIWIGDSESPTYWMAIGDIDNDGDLDIVESINSVGFQIFSNDGYDSFTTSGAAWGSTDMNAIDLVDMNGDGYPDLVAVDTGGVCRVYQNLGDGTFNTDSYGISHTGSSHYNLCIIPGDVDADGDLDIVTGNGDGQNFIFLNQGGSLTVQNFGEGGTYSSGVSLGDIDDDGDLDIISVELEGQNLIYLNDTAGGTPPVPEASTLVLLGGGLALTAGWFLVRRKKEITFHR